MNARIAIPAAGHATRLPERTPHHSPIDSAVVLLHGLCSSALEVRSFAQSLRRHGLQVVMPEVPGYSAACAADIDGRTDFRKWIDSVQRIVEKTAARDVHLCGVSMGATLALAVAAQCHRVKSLSLVSTTLFYDGWNVSRWRFLLPLAYHTPIGRFYAYRETPPYGVKNLRVRGWIENQLANRTLSDAGAATIAIPSLRQAHRLIRHVKQVLPAISVPVLTIHAREDDVASLSNPAYVARRIGSPLLSQVIVEDSYHMISLDNDRDKAAGLTSRFFLRHSADDADLGGIVQRN